MDGPIQLKCDQIKTWSQDELSSFKFHYKTAASCANIDAGDAIADASSLAPKEKKTLNQQNQAKIIFVNCCRMTKLKQQH